MRHFYHILSLAIGLEMVAITATEIPPALCNATYFNQHYKNKDSLDDTTIEQLKRTCAQYYPQCNSSKVFSFLDYFISSTLIKFGVEKLNTQSQGCYGYLLKLTDTENVTVFSKFLPYRFYYGGFAGFNLSFKEEYINSTLTLHLYELPSGINLRIAYKLPAYKCQRTTGHALAHYFLQHIERKHCLYFYDERNMLDVVSEFCHHFGFPANQQFIDEQRNATVSLEIPTSGECKIKFSAPKSESLDSKKLMLRGAMYGALITLCVCCVVAVTVCFVNRVICTRRISTTNSLTTLIQPDN